MIWWVIFLYLAGLVLILAEFIVPGGVVGIVGALLVVASAVIGISNFPDSTVFIIVVEVVGLAMGIALGMWYLSQSGAARKLKLASVMRAEDGYVNVASPVELMGKTGQVYSPLRPSGGVIIDGERIDAVSDGTYVEKGAHVRVIEVHGNRIVVEKCEEGETESDEAGK